MSTIGIKSAVLNRSICDAVKQSSRNVSKRVGPLTKLLNNLDHNKDRGYSYDALGRLVQATGGPSTSPLSTQTYSYDRYGNRTSVSASGYSAKNGSAGAGSAGGSPALSAQKQRGSSPTVREGSGTEPGAVATGSIPKPSDPIVALPTDLLAKNNSVALPARGSSPTVREGSEAVSDSSTSLYKPSTTRTTTTTAPTDPPTFTNSPLTAGVEVKAIHITELREAINALRARVGMGSYSWSESVTSGVFIKADHILEMRTALNQAIGAPSGGYTAGLAQGQPILAVHIQELRDRVVAAWSGDGSCPPGQTLLIDQFVKNFYQAALARQPNASELRAWSDQLRQAYYPGQTQLLAAAQYLGRQLFKSPEYVNRGRSDHEYVYDLYWAYLQRQPDQSGWDFWTTQAGQPNGRENVLHAFEVPGDTEFVAKLASLCPGAAGAAPIPLDGLASLSYDSATNHITTAGFNYDAAGNQTRTVRADGSAQRFQYDAANRLIQVKDDYGYVLQTLTYGDSNERLVSDEAGYRTYYASEGGTTIVEYFEVGASTTPVWSKSYVYLGARLLSTLTPNGGGSESVQFHHPDRLGTRLVTDPSNGTSFEQVTLPFGTPLNAESTGATNRRFTSYDRSPTTGLDYAVNRHYDSQQGRFTQVDPAGVNASSLTSPQTLNLYAYCTNDPVNHIDPNGLGFFSFLKKVFKGILKVLSNKWVQLALAVAMIAILHFYYHYSFGFAVASNASKAAPVLHAASTGGLLSAGGGAASGVITGVVLAADEGILVGGSVLADLGTLALAGSLGTGLGAQLAQHTDPPKSQDNKSGGGKTGPCPGFAKKFFDSTLSILRSVASALDVAPNLIITHASFESGWLDAHNQVLNNMFGYTHAGGLNQRFKSLQAAADAYIKHTGPVIQGSKTADEFLGKLGDAHYNADMVKYGKGFKARLEDVKKFGNGCGELAP